MIICFLVLHSPKLLTDYFITLNNFSKLSQKATDSN